MKKLLTDQKEILWILEEVEFSRIFLHTSELLTNALHHPSYKELWDKYKHGQITKRSQREKIVKPRKIAKILKSMWKVWVRSGYPEELLNYTTDFWKLKDSLVFNLTLDEDIMSMYSSFIDNFSDEQFSQIKLRWSWWVKKEIKQLILPTWEITHKISARELHTIKKKSTHSFFNIFYSQKRFISSKKQTSNRNLFTNKKSS